LDELLRLDGLGDSVEPGTCVNCTKLVGKYRCKDCFGSGLWCSGCIISSHRHLPLHRVQVRRISHRSTAPYQFKVQVWTDGFFKCETFENLGLIINLGHWGGHCTVPLEDRRITVVDLSGHHTVRIRLCGCSKSGNIEHFQQLLCVGWFLASLLRPRTVFTFDLLDTYHKISLQGKLNLYDFYNAIMQKADNHGSSKPKVGSSLSIMRPVIHPYPKVSLPRDVTLCSATAFPQGSQKRRGRPHTYSNQRTRQRVYRHRVPRLPPSGTKSA